MQVFTELVPDIRSVFTGYLAASRIDDEEDRQRAIREHHQRGADELLRLCFTNGGIYIKLAQHVGQLVCIPTVMLLYHVLLQCRL